MTVMIRMGQLWWGHGRRVFSPRKPHSPQETAPGVQVRRKGGTAWDSHPLGKADSHPASVIAVRLCETILTAPSVRP